jgi:hypothetical protein
VIAVWRSASLCQPRSWESGISVALGAEAFTQAWPVRAGRHELRAAEIQVALTKTFLRETQAAASSSSVLTKSVPLIGLTDYGRAHYRAHLDEYRQTFPDLTLPDPT